MSVDDVKSTCGSVVTMNDLGDGIPKIAVDNTVLSSSSVAYPCGLIAKYFFNDTFALADTKTGN